MAKPFDAYALRDLDALVPCRANEREGQSARVEVTVRREVHATQHAVEDHRWEQRLALRRAEQLQWQAEGRRPPVLARELLHAGRSAGDAQ